MLHPFKRDEHVFKSPDFQEVVKDAIRFFNGTPVHSLPPPERFSGSGVYSIYYTGNLAEYSEIAACNRLSYDLPLYVGKAVPMGWRQGRGNDNSKDNGRELFSRLRQHSSSIAQVDSLSLEDFYCRFVILENAESDLIGTIEAALIRLYHPLWNSEIDGFGNHDPGKGRYNQAKSEWDVLHPGRAWAEKCLGAHASLPAIQGKIKTYTDKLKG